MASVKVPNVNTCPKCGEAKASHRVCAKCGTYEGRQVLEVKEETE
jgi:large subunit ribosomal protein L32